MYNEAVCENDGLELMDLGVLEGVDRNISREEFHHPNFHTDY